MRVCSTCGETFARDHATCPSDGSRLSEWTDLELLHTERQSVVASPALGRGEPEVGQVLCGRYALESRIGVGGFGVVFAATDRRIQKRVAVKVLSPRVSEGEEDVERFRREALAASAIHHEGIVNVTDFDVDASGTRFIVMEFLAGVDLAMLLESEKSISPGRSLYIAAQAASALGAAHDAGIVHRDLKPANIYLTSTRTRRDFVKIIDFGISKVAYPGVGSITTSQVILGTPYYMSHEHARGLRLDGRTDIYALGVILYEIIVGRPPFEGRTAIEILTNAGTLAPLPPSQRRPDLNLPPELDALILRALARDRDQRYPSMEAFAAGITACLDDIDPVLANKLVSTPHTPLPAREPVAEKPKVSTLEQSSGEVARALASPPRVRRTQWKLAVFACAVVVATGVTLAVWMDQPDRPAIAPAAAPVHARDVRPASGAEPAATSIRPDPQPSPVAAPVPAPAPSEVAQQPAPEPASPVKNSRNQPTERRARVRGKPSRSPAGPRGPRQAPRW